MEEQVYETPEIIYEGELQVEAGSPVSHEEFNPFTLEAEGD